MSWKNESRRHELASKGIKSRHLRTKINLYADTRNGKTLYMLDKKPHTKKVSMSLLEPIVIQKATDFNKAINKKFDSKFDLVDVGISGPFGIAMYTTLYFNNHRNIKVKLKLWNPRHTEEVKVVGSEYYYLKNNKWKRMTIKKIKEAESK